MQRKLSAKQLIRSNEELRAKLQRAQDLLYQQRSELFDAGLLSEAEFTAITVNSKGAIERLEAYDKMKQVIKDQQVLLDKVSKSGFLEKLEKLADSERKLLIENGKLLALVKRGKETVADLKQQLAASDSA